MKNRTRPSYVRKKKIILDAGLTHDYGELKRLMVIENGQGNMRETS